jgi:septum formation protein
MRRALYVMASQIGLGARALSAPTAVTLDAAKTCACALPPRCPRLVLGSTSSSRRALLGAMGAPDAEVRDPAVDEYAIGDRDGDPAALVTAVASAKADALLDAHLDGHTDDDCVLVAGDQVVTYAGRIREKPRDAAEAKMFAESYSGASTTTVGCVVAHDVLTGRRVVDVHVASVDFGVFPDGLVDAMLASHGDVMVRCAGGLMVEHGVETNHGISGSGTSDL